MVIRFGRELPVGETQRYGERRWSILSFINASSNMGHRSSEVTLHANQASEEQDLTMR